VFHEILSHEMRILFRWNEAPTVVCDKQCRPPAW